LPLFKVSRKGGKTNVPYNIDLDGFLYLQRVDRRQNFFCLWREFLGGSDNEHFAINWIGTRTSSAAATGGYAHSWGWDAEIFLWFKPDDDETKHPLDPTIPDMNCNVDDNANYVSCYGSAIRQKEGAERRFTGLVDELRAILPPERWTGAEMEPRIGSIRSYTWGDQISDVGIDIDIVPQWSPDEEISYVVTIFGWTAIAPQL
jgi:hypothetical protein